MKSRRIKYFFDIGPYNFVRHLDHPPEGFRDDAYCLQDARVVAIGYDGGSRPVDVFYLLSANFDGWLPDPNGVDRFGGELVTAASVTIPDNENIAPVLVPYIAPAKSKMSRNARGEHLPLEPIDFKLFLNTHSGSIHKAKTVSGRFARGVSRPKQLRFPFSVLVKLFRSIFYANSST
jgi:hypothetical protein